MKKFYRIITSVEFCCLFAAFIFITLCSKSSFLYPLNDWGDANCYFTIGTGITHGLVPYRDLIDQKGPIIFFVYAIASLISSKTFLGVYLIEIICAALFLRIAIATINLYVDASEYNFLIAIILAGITCSTSSFCHGGSVEELLLPVFSYGIYLLLKYLEKNKMPNKKEMLIFGILAGIIFYTKFSLCIVYISIILFMIINSFRHKEFASLFKNAQFFILGCLLISFAVLTYFGVNHSLIDFWDKYFYDSTFNYLPEDTADTKMKNILKIKGYLLNKRSVLLDLAVASELFWVLKKRKRFTLAFLLVTLVSYLYMQYWIAVPRMYYGLPFMVFGILGFCLMVEFLQKKMFRITRFYNVIALAFIFLVAFAFTNNKYMLLKNNDTCIQTVFAKEMKSYGYKNFHMLYFGSLDEGFYKATGKLPNCPVFNTMNITSDEFKNIQRGYVEDEKVEFIVSPHILCDTTDYTDVVKTHKNVKTKHIYAFNSFSYELIDEKSFYFEGHNKVMRLYKIKDNQI